MITGFEKIVEERIRRAQAAGEFDRLPGAGRPLILEENGCVPEDLRMAYKILKNADCLPPEIELRKEIQKTEELLEAMPETAEKYQTMKKLNYLILKLNALRKTCVDLEMPQHYSSKVVARLQKRRTGG